MKSDPCIEVTTEMIGHLITEKKRHARDVILTAVLAAVFVVPAMAHWWGRAAAVILVLVCVYQAATLLLVDVRVWAHSRDEIKAMGDE